jgi:hypothetical protein
MPSHRRLGPDGRHCLHDRWKPPIQLKEEQAIGVGKLDPTAHLAMKHDQLTSERSILSLKPTDRPERRTNSLIHKSQGSEYPAVVIPIMTQHYAMLQRNLLYTGVTRGKRLVVLVGQKKAVTIAVRDAATRRASTNAAGPHGGSGFSAESAGAALARWGRAGLDTARIRRFAGAAAGALGRSVRDPDRH